MIVAFSTSSPIASVALLSESGEILGSGCEDARMNASGACLRILRSLLNAHPGTISGYLADLGPGSFTGVKVGVTLAKTMAMAEGVLAGGVAAFDLISPIGLVVLPSKKGEFFWRRPGGGSVEVHQGLPDELFVGFGVGIEAPVYPLAARFGALLLNLTLGDPVRLNPKYILEPAISTPNKPFRGANA